MSSDPAGSELAQLRQQHAELETELRELRASQVHDGDRGQRDGEDRAQRDELFRRLVDSVLDYAIFMLDPVGRVVTWNPGARRIKGYEDHEIIGRHFSLFYPKSETRAGKCAQELNVAAQAGRFEEEGWRVRKDGSVFWAHVVISAMRDDQGQLIGFAKVTRDLTDRRRATAEQAVHQASEERFRLLVSSVTDYAIFVLDAQGHIATWNPGAQRFKGYEPEEIIGRHFSVFYTPEDVESGKCELELELASKEGRYEEEGWRVRKDGTRFWANVVISAMRDSDGRLVGFAKVTRDLSERRRAEEERAARLAAERANRDKDAFLAILGHELRNPLAPIVTALELLKLQSPSPPGRAQEIIERQVRHMMRLVDDLLDVSRISQSKLILRKQVVDVRDSIARAIEAVRPLLQQRRHHVEVDVPTEPVRIEADETRLVQVFVNLLTNAAKYTDPGGHMRIRCAGEGAEVVAEVNDDGAGMPAELLPRVFDLFVQDRQTIDRSVGGLGIGLSLVRTIVNMHGGRIEARSDGPRRGSTFLMHLPAATAAQTQVAVEPGMTRPAPIGQARSVLIVDDNVDALELLGDALRSSGFQVTTSSDARDAMELARRLQPDICILDLGLPVIDGFQLAESLRGVLSPSAVLIALTGYGQPSDRERSRRAGFDAHLVKPVNLQDLLDRLALPRERQGDH